MTKRRIHRVLAGLLGLFILGHLMVHLSALWGIEAHLLALSLMRNAYRNVLIEPLLLLAIMAQIYTGVGFLRRRWRMRGRNLWLKIQLFSGGYLVFFMLNHTVAALLTRYGLGLDTNFYWAAATVNISPFKWFFAPYYALAIIAIFAHIGASLQQKQVRVGLVALIAGPAIAGLILVAFMGGLYEIDLPAAYQDYFRSLADFGWG